MTVTAVCFLRGTQIWTPSGERKVEDLRINDLVVTSSGEAKPIEWVWARRFERQYGQKWPEEIAPIRVAPSALGPNTPHRELFLSRYHCLYLDGVLIPVVDFSTNRPSPDAAPNTCEKSNIFTSSWNATVWSTPKVLLARHSELSPR